MSKIKLTTRMIETTCKINVPKYAFADCELCGERYGGDGVNAYLREVETKGECFAICLECLKGHENEI